MKLFAYLTEAFIAVFGITRPEPGREKTANLLIGGFVLALLLAVVSVLGFLVYSITHR